MGCGSSGQVVPNHEDLANGHKKPDAGQMANGNHDKDNDDVPTVMLPETPAKPKTLAFEIPLEEIDGNRRIPTTPPPHVQRLLNLPQADITLPDIEEKLAEAEQRRQSILQQRAASAQKRTQKMMKSFNEMESMDRYNPESIETEYLSRGTDHDPSTEMSKHLNNALPIPPEPGVYEGKNI